MNEASLYFDTHFQIGEVDPRIFGGFLEHLGRCIYGGVYDPEHAKSDSNGLRTDVIDALRELEVTVARYPGGNFVSGYHWEDGVGPKAERPVVRDLAWQSLESNQFGTDEFISLCQKLDWQPMLAVNLGTGSAEEARNWVEYCNVEVGSRYADRRRLYGNANPFKVPLWCLGNEMDGPWQLGHVPVDEYCNRAQMAAQMMKNLDRSIEVVACGSSAPQMPTYLEWDRHVMERLGADLADFISLHRYVGNPADDTSDYLALSASIDHQIESVDAAAKLAAHRLRSARRTYLCFDEWNVWYRARGGKYSDGAGRFAPPLLEETYNLEDALVVAQFLMSFIRHADVVKIANIAQLVNVIAPIRATADGILKQSIFHSFRMISSRKGGVSLQQSITCDQYESSSNGNVTYIDSAITIDGDKLHIFLLNRHLDQDLTISMDLKDRDIKSLLSAEVLHHPNVKAENSFDNPNVVAAQTFDQVEIKSGVARTTLPPHSFAALTFDLVSD